MRKQIESINEYLRMSLRYMIILLLSGILGFILLLMVYQIPTSKMVENTFSDIPSLQLEGLYPSVDGSVASTMDNFTDALMLGTAIYDETNTSLLKKATEAKHAVAVSENDPITELVLYIQFCVLKEHSTNSIDGYPGNSYARYWHGYLVFLKPILSFMDYFTWRTVNHVLQIGILGILLVAMAKRFSWKYVVPFMGGILLLRPLILFYSLQYSSMYYITLGALLVLTVLYHRLRQRNNLPYFFLFLGIVTNYFDFLTYPSVSLGACLVFCLLSEQKQSLTLNLRCFFGYSLSWLLGYAGMWVNKWALASLMLKRNIFVEAISCIVNRSSSIAYGEPIHRSQAICKNITVAFEGVPVWVVALFLITTVLIGFLQWKKQYRQWISYTICMIVLALIPFLWYIVLSNHSYVHSYITYRTLSTTVMAVLADSWKIDSKTVNAPSKSL